jgi:DNA-directed RNA polymerase subunit M/transcription elongation factor TFIIS
LTRKDLSFDLLNQSSLPYISNPEKYDSIYDIVEEELKQKKIPFIIKRNINNVDEYLKLEEKQRGGGLLNKTMKCNSCGWSWKAADGGSDVSTCHKCGGSALPKAQDGGCTSCTESMRQKEGSYNKGKEYILDPRFKQKGGSIKNEETIYKDYINGDYKTSEEELLGQKVYDKLNRVHYKDAKKANMSSPNYIMSHIYKA